MSAAVSMLPSLHDLGFAQTEAMLQADGVSPRHARALWHALYREGDTAVEVPPPLRRWLDAGLGRRFRLDTPPVASRVDSSDGLTRKLLLRLDDGQEIETVVMGYPGRHTACISTQAGCALGCVFCATGQMGFVRHLRPGEIVSQVLAARRLLKEAGLQGPRNLVLMGMGEPLHNYDAVMRALEIVTDNRGLGLGPSRISVSTVGLVPAIRRFTDEGRPYNLAVSLHAATDAERSALLPVNRKWPLAELMEACRHHNRVSGRKIFLGWTLISGRSDTPEHAHRVVELLRGVDAHVNLIHLNPTRGYDGRTVPDAAGDAFQRILRAAGLPCTFRQRRGIDVDAGCGQLRATRMPRRA